jgi:hypothetical protein
MKKIIFKKTFDLLRRSKVRTPKLFRSTPEKEEAKIKEYLNKGTRMKKLLSWFKEKKSWWSIWIIVLIFTLAATMFTKCNITIQFEYKVPPVVKTIIGNK